MQSRNSISSGVDRFGSNILSLDDVARSKPRLLFLRKYGNLPAFIVSQLQQHVKCLSIWFDVRVISEDGDYNELCDRFQPDLTLVESGVYGSAPRMTNVSSCPEVPKLGFLNADAYCPTRSTFLADMARWDIENFFSISVSMPEYLPGNKDQLFIWPNFVDPKIYRDYGQSKNIPVLNIGSRAIHYPWRNRINELIAQQFPSLACPHFGWFDQKKAARMVYDEEYAKLINAAWFVPTCGTIAREVVRKHFEVPACNTCLVTERTAALEDAGFVDMENCVFATESDVIDKLDYLFANRDILEKIGAAGRNLVHSRHTSRQRDQIFQWYLLNKQRHADQRIVQVRPFAPLTLAGPDSRARNYQSLSNSMDRAVLAEGHKQLQCGNYDAAERAFLRCLNYHRMPEPMLGLALSALKKGDSAGAVRWTSRLIECGFELDRATEPDPVEWSYFIISLLCDGNVKEAAKRVDEFPLLNHRQVDRCRWVIGILNGTSVSASPSEGQFSRSSIHQLPETNLMAWIEELCETLKRCGRGYLAQQIRAALRENKTQASVITGRSNAEWIPFVGAPTHETLKAKLRRRAPKGIRSLVSKLQARATRLDEFASTVSVWAREEPVLNALVLGPSDRSSYTRAFLDGVRKNPLMPRVVCVGESSSDFRRLQKEFTGSAQIHFSSKPLQAIKIDEELSSFDLVLIEGGAFDEKETVEAVNGARTVLVRDIDTPSGNAVVVDLSSNHYRVAYDRSSEAGHSVIFTKPHGESPRLVAVSVEAKEKDGIVDGIT
ncbi:hypothetical protein V1291_001869 [Nitrobacteraceae bacterium AZCC 1564]